MKKNKHFKKLICLVLSYILIVPFLPLQIVKAANTTNAIINNGGGIVKDGDWLYCLNWDYSTQKYAIYRIKTDGTQNKKINDINYKSFTIDGDWIYFKYSNDNTYRVKKDGSNLQNLKIKSNRLDFVGDSIYYLSDEDYNLYKIKKDGTNKTAILNDIYNAKVMGNFIYYSKYTGSGKLIYYRTNLSGRNQTQLNTKTNNENFYIRKYTDNYVYFYRSDSLYRMKPDGSAKIKVSSYDASIINDDWIYDYSEQAFKKLGTSTVIKETGVDFSSVKIIGDYIQYYKYDYNAGRSSYSYYLLKTDGTKKIKIDDGGYKSEYIDDGKYFYYISYIYYQGSYLNKFDISKGKVVMTKKL